MNRNNKAMNIANVVWIISEGFGDRKEIKYTGAKEASTLIKEIRYFEMPAKISLTLDSVSK